MKGGYYIYNNEAIASCIILAVLQNIKQIDIARICLVLPFLLDDRTVSALNKEFNTEITLKEFVSQHSRMFCTFNKRYMELLPVLINSIAILEKTKAISVAKTISINTSINDFGDIGDRFSKIQKSIGALLKLTQSCSTTELYKILGIQL